MKLDYASKDVAVPVDSEDPDENKYARRKPTGFLAKLIKAHEVHPKYRVNVLAYFLVLIIIAGRYRYYTENLINAVYGGHWCVHSPVLPD